MKKWAADKNPKLRRLASECRRPRVPWAMALPKFKKDPAPILPILETLKDDPSEDVRRSVANNINDISKDNPEVALELCEKWTGHSQETDGLIKHACRTMLKAGNKRAMVLFGYCDPAGIKVENLTLDKDKIQLGEALNFFFDITISAPGKSKVRLEYTVYFMKANGKLSGKVFKITENDYQQGTHSFKKKHAFVKMSTRKYYTGEHQVSIIINGEEKAKTTLQLEIP
ncbi:MAG: hypothetical protein GY757_33735 [bacterium]|nr:hypothetical protein [bacterium]